jgi:hypothetical protein
MERSWFHMHARASPADRHAASRKEGRDHAPHGQQTRFPYTTCRLQCCTTSCRPCAGASLGGPPCCVELALARPLLRVVCRNTCGPVSAPPRPTGSAGGGIEGSAWVFFSYAVPGRSYRCKRKNLAPPRRPTVSTSGHLHRHTAMLEHLQTR